MTLLYGLACSVLDRCVFDGSVLDSVLHQAWVLMLEKHCVLLAR